MEMTDSFDFSFVWNIFAGTIFHLITFGVCIYYIIRKQSIEGFLLAAGAFIHILTSVFYTIVVPLLVRTGNYPVYENRFMFTVAGAISFIGSLIYIIGFIILVLNYLSLSTKKEQGFT